MNRVVEGGGGSMNGVEEGGGLTEITANYEEISMV